MKIVTAMMKHETNTFSPVRTDWARFEAWGAHTGQEAVGKLEGDPATIDEAERRARGIDPIAASLEEVCDALKAGPFLDSAFGPQFRTAYLAVLENAIADKQAAGADYAKRYSRVI